MTTTVRGLEELKALAGKNLGSSGWLEITQDRVNTFADATGDHRGSTSTSRGPSLVPSVGRSHTATSPCR